MNALRKLWNWTRKTLMSILRFPTDNIIERGDLVVFQATYAAYWAAVIAVNEDRISLWVWDTARREAQWVKFTGLAIDRCALVSKSVYVLEA